MSYSSDPTSKVPSDAANAHPPITDTLTSDKVPPAMAPNVVLHAHQLAKRVASGERSLTILDNLDLSVAAGESVAILGKSGAGKST
ncbi:MAG: ATP-binding cassette domain-containing protein, partial [Halomonas sp.]|nr:ATP-binding cassette domain-containing protein [Halomonas sp.]